MKNRYKLKFKIKTIRYKGNFRNIVALVEIIEATLLEGEEYFPAMRECILKGNFLKVEEGDIFTTEGRLMTDSKYNQFVFQSEKDCLEFLPIKKDEVIKYIFRKAKKKISMKRIGTIMDITGSGCSLLKKIYKNEKYLENYEDITKRERHTLEIVANENYALDEILLFFNELGLSSQKAVQFFDKWGIAALPKIKKDPYYLVFYEFLTVQEADRIMINLLRTKNKEAELAWNKKERISACIFEALKQETVRGDTISYLNTIFHNAVKIITAPLNEEVNYECFLNANNALLELGVQQCIKNQVIVERIYKDNRALQIKRIYKIEQEITKNLASILSNRTKIKYNKQTLDEYLNSMVSSSKEQIEAIHNAISKKVSILTGGPGTGKTYTINSIIKFLLSQYPEMNTRCLAPTGRAASKMFEMTGVVSTTIHSALNGVLFVDENSGKCYKKKTIEEGEIANKKIEGDYFIIDEMSMVDLEVFSSFLSNSNPDAQYLFVGDEDQLPSVQFGSVLKDLIDSHTISVSRLTTIFRQGKDSVIVTNAHRYKSRDVKFINEIEFKKNSDMMFMKSAESKIIENLLKLVNALNEKNIKLKDILILSPMKVGQCGTVAINSMMQKEFNQSNIEGVYKGKKVYRLGDPVIQTKNDKSKGEFGVYNGLIGTITNISIDDFTNEIIYMDVDFGEPTGIISYSNDDLEQLDLAYAITVHKSQGSQAKVVIFIVSECHNNMLTMNLVYTGITRAEKKIICLGSPNAFYRSALNFKGMDRNSDLYITLKNSMK